MKKLNYDLNTKYTYLLSNDVVLPEYPRPSFVRDNYINLNGFWEYDIVQRDNDICDFKNKILVPYCIESSASKVQKFLLKDDILVYRKTLDFDKELYYDNIILHFGAIMQISEIFINNEFVCKNNNGFLPISINIKKYLKRGQNELIVRVKNMPDLTYPTGKENVKRGGMWYTKTTGIYKSVWVEYYNDGYIENVEVKTSLDGYIKICVKSQSKEHKAIIGYYGEVVKELSFENEVSFDIENPKLWSPNNPNLYSLIIENDCDKIETYFAIRKFEIKDKKFYLNNEEIFINGVLDQGYFSDGIYTPSSYKVFEDDIIEMRKLGFNTLRKHIKVECDYYYYLCDKLGMLVFQDFPNSGKYDFFKDSLLATLGVKIKKKTNDETRKNHFIEQGKRIIDILKVHPSVVYYTIFNEGWGEFDTEEMYELFKSYANEYVFDSASGWFNQKKSDVYSIHNYFFKLKVPKSDKPVILSEYGGYNLKVQGHVFNEEKEYGYHKCKTQKELRRDLKILFNKIDELKSQGLAGAIYTQLSDVEDETNGLLTYDRYINKLRENGRQ